MNESMTKRCIKCDYLKGFQSFGSNSDTCKSCVYIEKKRKWFEEGIPSYRVCRKCGERKHLFIEYHRNGDYRSKRECRTCCAIYAKKYHNRRSVANGRFEFNGKIWCKTCERPKSVHFFDPFRTTCRECSGLPPTRVKLNNQPKPLFLVDKEGAKEREERIARKIAKREKFVKRFKEEAFR